MAIKKSWETAAGVTAADAYHRVVTFIRPDDSNMVRFDAWIYYDEAAREGGKEPMEILGHQMTFDPAAVENQLAQCYTYLKTLPQYEGGIDA